MKGVPADTNSRTSRLISPSTVSIADFTGTNQSRCLFDQESTIRSARDDAAIPTPHAAILNALRAILNALRTCNGHHARQIGHRSAVRCSSIQTSFGVGFADRCAGTAEATRLTLSVSVGIWTGRLQNFV